MKNKLKIADLKVKSFVTEIDNEVNETQVIGGRGSNNRSCVISIILCYSVDVCPTEGERCVTLRC